MTRENTKRRSAHDWLIITAFVLFVIGVIGLASGSGIGALLIVVGLLSLLGWFISNAVATWHEG